MMQKNAILKKIKKKPLITKKMPKRNFNIKITHTFVLSAIFIKFIFKEFKIQTFEDDVI